MTEDRVCTSVSSAPFGGPSDRGCDGDAVAALKAVGHLLIQPSTPRDGAGSDLCVGLPGITAAGEDTES